MYDIKNLQKKQYEYLKNQFSKIKHIQPAAAGSWLNRKYPNGAFICELGDRSFIIVHQRGDELRAVVSKEHKTRANVFGSTIHNVMERAMAHA